MDLIRRIAVENQTQFLLAQRLMHGPSIIITRGVVYVTLGGRTSVLTKGGLSSRKHGYVGLLYAEESWGVVRHITVTQHAEQILFIPHKKRMNLSNGHFQLQDVNYDSFLQAHDQGTMVTTPRKERISLSCTFGDLPQGRYEMTFRVKTNPSRSAQLEIMPYGGVLRVRWLGGAAVATLVGKVEKRKWTLLGACSDYTIDELLYYSLRFVD
jgi:hypothetical protein